MATSVIDFSVGIFVVSLLVLIVTFHLSNLSAEMKLKKEKPAIAPKDAAKVMLVAGAGALISGGTLLYKSGIFAS